MRVTIADSTADHYEVFAKKQGKPVDQLIETQLARFKSLEPGTRAVVIGPAQIEALSVALGGLPVKDAADLVKRVEELAGVSFQHIRLNFSPNHLAELAHRAERQGKPVEAIIIETVNRMQEEFFWGSGGGEAVLTAEVPSATA